MALVSPSTVLPWKSYRSKRFRRHGLLAFQFWFASSKQGKYMAINGSRTSAVVLALLASIVCAVAQAAVVNLDQHGLTGTWYNPATGGQGFLIETYPDLKGSGHGYLAAGWYTFDLTAAGGQRWYTMQGDAISGSASVPLTIYTATDGNFNAPPTISAAAVGTATLSFTDCTHATLAYHFTDGRPDGSIPLTRLDTNVTCTTTGDNSNPTENYLMSGAWYDSTRATSGQGFFLDFSPALTTLFGAWYTYQPSECEQQRRRQPALVHDSGQCLCARVRLAKNGSADLRNDRRHFQYGRRCKCRLSGWHGEHRNQQTAHRLR